MWTADEIRQRLAISTAVFQNEQLGEREIAQVKKAGIDAVEISIVRRSFNDQDPKQVSAVLDACRACEVEVVSVHGPFDLPYREEGTSAERAVAEGSIGPIRFAEEAGARHYVGHFGNDDRARRIVKQVVDQTSDCAVVVTTENQTGQPLKPYDDFAASFGHERVSWTLDIGHARDPDKVNPFVKARASEVLEGACGHVGHTHLHDTFDLPTKQDHRPPMHKDGLIRWVDVFEGLHTIGYGGHFVFEDGRGEDVADWVAHAASFPRRFAERYASSPRQ